VANTEHNNTFLGLWVPAFAGTTWNLLREHRTHDIRVIDLLRS
jgi:hypothetical protein